jgi:sporulation protein YtfJ
MSEKGGVSMTHPINELMVTAMQNIKEMVDVNTIVGDAVTTPDGMVVIPISKVTFGFASGGGEYEMKAMEGGRSAKKSDYDEGDPMKLPFAGGSGAGISISPEAFMVVGQGQVKLMGLHSNTSVDRIIDIAPDIINKISDMAEKKMNKSRPSE